MRQRVHVAPFHRRVLPWIFIVAFLALAPVLIFYTAGYRWDPKKGQVERNGTVIIDSIPNAADISIDGRPILKTTPITIQDMPPGLHHFEITKAGYHSWAKSLNVYSELVTFANSIRLWKDAQPTFISSTSVQALSASPDQRTILEITSASPTQALIYNASTLRTSVLNFPHPINARPFISWSANGRYALLETADGSSQDPWVIDVQTTHAPVELPAGTYRWNKSALNGQSDRSQIVINLPDFGVTQTPLAADTLDTSDQGSLVTATGTSQVIYVSRTDKTHGLVLPPGNWSFWSIIGSNMVLRDGTAWLSLLPTKQPPEQHSVSGDLPRAFTSGGQTRYLLVNQTELLTWDPTNDPQLVYRQSDPIVNAAWHAQGSDIFFATRTGVFVLNLDPRDGLQITQLGAFDSVSDFAVSGKNLLIAATKNGQTGVWSLPVE